MLETKMKAKIRKLLPHIMFQSIETSTTIGFPDVLYGLGETMGVAEVKEIDRIPVNKFKVSWRIGQLAWHHRFVAKNESPYRLILTLKDSWYIIPIIQESYLMMEVSKYYIGGTKDLINVKDRILHLLRL